MSPMIAAGISRALDLIQHGRVDDGVVELRRLMELHGCRPPAYPDTQTVDRRSTATRPVPRPPGGHAA